MATVPGADKGKDPYMVLGVQWSASQDEIEAAFESAKLSLAADGVDESSQEYAELAAAFSQLSDPEKRREIDMESEREALELPAPSQQEAVTSLGLRGSVMAAVATRLGRDVRTAVAPKVLQQLESGSLIGPELGFDVSVSGHLDRRGGCQVYTVSLDAEQVETGFHLHCQAPPQSRFKLLFFARTERPDSPWSLLATQDCAKVRGEQGAVAAAGMCFGDYDVHELTVPAPGSDRTGDWEAQLFQHLESLVPRPRHQLRAGQYLVAVYCDNFLKGLKYQLLLHAFASEELEQLRSLEEQLVRKREQIRAFEWEFREAQQRWQHCCDRLLQESAEMDAMVSKRDAAYLAFQGSAQPPSPAAPQDTEAGHEELGAAAGSGRWGQGVLEGVRLGGRGLLGRLRPGAKDAAAPSTPGQRSSGDSETAEAAPDGGPAAGPAAAASGSGSARFGAAGRLGGSMRQLGSSVKGMLSRGRAQTPWSDAAPPVDLGDSHVNVAGMDDPVDSSPEADTQPVRSAAAAPAAARAGEQAATATAGVDHLAASLCDEGGQS